MSSSGVLSSRGKEGTKKDKAGAEFLARNSREIFLLAATSAETPVHRCSKKKKKGKNTRQDMTWPAFLWYAAGRRGPKGYKLVFLHAAPLLDKKVNSWV